MTFLCDTHCHLYLEEFQDDINTVIHQAILAGVKKILVPGIDYPTSKTAVELSEKYAGVLFPAVGIHPNYSSRVGIEEINLLKELLSNTPAIRAIGEIGLDFYRTWSTPDEQYYIFNEMLKLAEEFNLPVCLHVRDAADEIIKVLEPWYASLVGKQHPLMENPGVFHAFDGNANIVKWALAHNFRLGIGGTVTYKKAQLQRDALLQLGSEHLILETDAPYLSPHPYRGKRNEPSYVQYTANKLSVLLSESSTKIAEITSQNANNLFRWMND